MSYIVKDNKIFKEEYGLPTIEITSFDYEILTDTRHVNTDGTSTHQYSISVTTEYGEKLPVLIQSADDYEKGQWPAKFGSKITVLNNIFFKKYILPNKVRYKNKDIDHVTEYGFTGFDISDENNRLYIDNGGAISATGYDSKLRAKLSNKLAYYKLPPPTKKNNGVIKEIKAVLDLWRLTPKNEYTGILLKSIAIRAVISIFLKPTAPDFIKGETGSRKSALAAIAQSFFGPKFGNQFELPADWSSTAVALEDLCVTIRQAILTIDEFTPKKEINESELSKKAEIVLRGNANGQSKSRGNPDGSARTKSPPCAIILMTGESMTLKVVESLVKRIVFFQLEKGDVDLNELTRCQELAAEGVYAKFTSTFIQHVLKDYNYLKDKIPKMFQEYRNKARAELDETLHPRCHENIASIIVSLKVLYLFAKSKAVITEDEMNDYVDADWENLKSLMYEQESIVLNKKVYKLVFQSITKDLSCGKIHLKDYGNGRIPNITNPEIVGWKDGRPQGTCIGLLDVKNNNVYIASDTNLLLLTRLLSDDDRSLLPATQKGFWKVMKNSRALKSFESGGNRVRKTNPSTKKPIQVYHLDLNLPIDRNEHEIT